MDKTTRQERIKKLLGRNEVQNQRQLQQLLLTERVSVTQATLSRDLRDIGVIKGPHGYRLTERLLGADRAVRQLRRSLRGLLHSVRQGGTMVIVQSRLESGREVARIVKAAGIPLVLGVVADDDTVFIATASPNQASHLTRLLQRAGG